MPRSIRRTRNVAAVLLAVGVFTLLFAVLRAGARTAEETITSTDLAVMMQRAGLEPDALTAAGVDDQDVDDVVADVLEHLGTHLGTIQQAHSNLAAARTDCNRLERLVRSGQASEQEITACAAAQSALSSAESAYESAIDALFEAGIDSLSAGEQTLLTQIRANGEWELPVAYRTVSRTESQWVALRDALDDERIADDTGAEQDENAAALLQTVRADSTVSTALSAIDVSLDSVTSAYESAIAP